MDLQVWTSARSSVDHDQGLLDHQEPHLHRAPDGRPATGHRAPDAGLFVVAAAELAAAFVRGQLAAASASRHS